MATGYTLMTGRPQAVLLHAGVGMLQGSMGVHGALQNEVPMVVMSGKSQSLGEDPDLDIEQQWYGGLTVGGIERFVEPVAKWARAVTSPYTLYESVIRAGEMAQRVPKGPIYLNVALEHMLHDWTPPARRARCRRRRPAAAPEDVEQVAELLRNAKSPVIVAETSGRDPKAFSALVELADLLAIPVINGRANAYANFPTDHPLYLGMGNYKARGERRPGAAGRRSRALVPGAAPADRRQDRRDPRQPAQGAHDLSEPARRLFISKATWRQSLKLLIAAAKSASVDSRSDRARGGSAGRASTRATSPACAAEREKAQNGSGIDPLSLLGALGEVMPRRHDLRGRNHHPFPAAAPASAADHAAKLLPRLRRARPRHRHRARDQARGAQRPVALLVGDGSFLYNPIIQALGASKRHDLPIIIIVLNNKKYEAMRKGHVHHYPDGASASKDLHYGVTIDGPDYEKLGSHFDFHGQRVEKLDDSATALQKRARGNAQGGKDGDAQRRGDPVEGLIARDSRSRGSSCPSSRLRS